MQPSRSISFAAMRMAREPLLHFALLGAIIFGIDAVMHPPAKDEKVITVTKAMRQSFIDNFDEDKERAPSSDQLQKMIDSWVASEILYREGKTLAVDRGDETIRDRIAYKMQLLIFDQIRVPRPTDEQLQAWFAENHARFDEPERVSFYITPPTDQATAQRQLEDIVQQREAEELQNLTRAILARPVASLAASFGDDFRDGLLKMPEGNGSCCNPRTAGMSPGWIPGGRGLSPVSARSAMRRPVSGIRKKLASSPGKRSSGSRRPIKCGTSSEHDPISAIGTADTDSGFSRAHPSLGAQCA